MSRELLYQLACSPSNLEAAWQKVKGKGSQGGIDGVGVTAFAEKERENLRSLRDQLLSYRYVPEPCKRIYLPKFNGTNEKRPISLPSLKDKIVQEAVRSVIEPLFEAEFTDASYAYRPGKSSYKAVRRVLDYTNRGQRWVAVCDIDSFFDNLNHALLLQELSRKISDESILRLIKLWIKMGFLENRKGWQNSVKGIAQGNVISPLLANIYLLPLDLALQHAGYPYVRYSDDFCLLARNQPELERSVQYTEKFLNQRLKLYLGDKELSSLSHGITFLGIRFDNQGLEISSKKKTKIHDKLSYLFRQTGKKSLEDIIIKLNEMIAGWQRYYCRLLEPGQLTFLRRQVIDRLVLAIHEQLKNGRLKNQKSARSALTALCWDKEDDTIVKEIMAEVRRIAAQERTQKPKTITKAVAGKKRQYQRVQASSSDLLISTPGSFLGKTSRQITVKCQGKLLKKLATDNLKQIVIISRGVSLSSDVIRHCTENSVPIHFLSYQGTPYAIIYSPLYPTLDLGLQQLEACRGTLGTKLAKQFIVGKLKNQANLMKYCSKYRKSWDDDFAERFDKFVADMKKSAKMVQAVKENNPETFRGQLLAIEGRSASNYWKMFETVVNNKVEFNGRQRRGAADLVNSLLNYGYGVLYPRIWLSLSLAGLNLRLSFFHTEQPGKPTLVYDMIEEFRQPVVDRAVISLINHGEELKQDGVLLTAETREKVARAVMERLNTPVKFRNRNLSLAEIIHTQTRALAAAIRGEGVYKPYVAKW